MVKAGFILEGASERMVVDANGGGKLLPQNIDAFIARLDTAGAERIFVLTDLEGEAQVATVRERVAHQRIHFAFIAVKALEAWYVADSVAMNAWLGIVPATVIGSVITVSFISWRIDVKDKS
ncbi:hypothetical protein DNF23_32565 [Pseudomonas syringae pv. pisi]